MAWYISRTHGGISGDGGSREEAQTANLWPGRKVTVAWVDLLGKGINGRGEIKPQYDALPLMLTPFPSSPTRPAKRKKKPASHTHTQKNKEIQPSSHIGSPTFIKQKRKEDGRLVYENRFEKSDSYCWKLLAMKEFPKNLHQSIFCERFSARKSRTKGGGAEGEPREWWKTTGVEGDHLHSNGRSLYPSSYSRMLFSARHRRSTGSVTYFLDNSDMILNILQPCKKPCLPSQKYPRKTIYELLIIHRRFNFIHEGT